MIGAVVVALLVLGVLTWRLLDRSTDYERAASYLPAGTLRVTYTDWDAVRASADGESLGGGSSESKVQAFLDRAFEQDLTSTSAVAESTFALHRRYGFSPLNVSWEVFGQSPEGQVAIMQLPDSADLDAVERKLRSLGYDEPVDGVGEGGTWAGSSDLVAALDPTLTPVQQNVAVLRDQRVVVMSDSPATVSSAADVITGESDGLDVAPLTALAGEPATATLWAEDFACGDLAMSAADEEDQRVAASLVDEAGGVSPLSGLVMAQQRDRTITVAMEFESSDQAERNLQPRVDLAAGEAPGQGGSFAERFTLTSGEASGSTVVLRLDPGDTDFVFSDITSGPVLFATC